MEDVKNLPSESITDVKLDIVDQNNSSSSNVSNSTSSSSTLIDYSNCVIEQHDVKSRDVTEADLGRVITDAHLMYQICFAKNGIYMGALAMAHQQITKDDPLRFFVTYDQKIIINPVIVNHTKVTVDSPEGCITFMHKPQKIVQRYNKITVEFQTLNTDGTLSDKMVKGFSSKESKVFQHEIDHFDCKYIY